MKRNILDLVYNLDMDIDEIYDALMQKDDNILYQEESIVEIWKKYIKEKESYFYIFFKYFCIDFYTDVQFSSQFYNEKDYDTIESIIKLLEEDKYDVERDKLF